MVTVDVTVTTSPTSGAFQGLPAGTHAVVLGSADWWTASAIRAGDTVYTVGTASGGVTVMQIRGAARPSNTVGVTRFPGYTS